MPPATGCAAAGGAARPAAEAAIAAAWAFRISRRDKAMTSPVAKKLELLLEHHVGGQHTGPAGDVGEHGAQCAARVTFQHDDKLRCARVMNFNALRLREAI